MPPTTLTLHKNPRKTTTHTTNIKQQQSEPHHSFFFSPLPSAPSSSFIGMSLPWNAKNAKKLVPTANSTAGIRNLRRNCENIRSCSRWSYFPMGKLKKIQVRWVPVRVVFRISIPARNSGYFVVYFQPLSLKPSLVKICFYQLPIMRMPSQKSSKNLVFEKISENNSKKFSVLFLDHVKRVRRNRMAWSAF